MSVSRNYLWAGAAAMVSLGAQGAVAQTSVTIDMVPGAGAVSMSVSSRGFDDASEFVRGCPGFVPDSVDGASFDVASGINQLFFEAQGPDTVALVIESPAGTYSCAVADGGTMAHGVFRPAPGRYAVFPSGRVLGERITTTLSASVDGAPPTTPAEPTQPPVAQTGVIDIARLGPPRQGTVRLDREAAMVRQLVAQAPFTVTTRANNVTPDDVHCAGHIAPDAADVVFELEHHVRPLSFFTLSDGDPVLAIRDPSGTWRCNDDSFGLESALTYQVAEPGQYHVWVGSFGSAGRGSYQLFVSLGPPRWTTESINTDGEPRAGRVRLDLMEARTRQTLATAPIASPTRIDPLIPGMYCAGHVDTDGPDVVLTVDQAQDVLSIYAMSSTDLTLSVLGPDDRWSCNDDTFGLNPAITYNNAMPGEYRIWVGSFGANRSGTYELFATAGQPRWVDAELDATAAPSAGYVSIGTGTDRDFRLPIVMQPSRIPARSFDAFCPGFITPDQPTVIVTIEDSLPELTFYAVSEADGMMLIQTPDGSLLCNDDFQGLNPGIVINNGAPGDYAVWVGTFGGRGGTGTFGVTRDVPLWTVDRDL